MDDLKRVWIGPTLSGERSPARTGRTLVNKLARAYRRSALRKFLRRVQVVHVPLDRAHVARALGMGLIVGIGMAAFAQSVSQPPLLLGIGSGIAAFLLMLFIV
jgi:hypothetical protein